MLRLFRRPAPLCAVLLLSTACMQNRGHSDPSGAAGAPVVFASAGSCEAAALTLAPGTVVGKMKGADIKVEDLGDELAQQEKQALRSYCKAISEARKSAVDNHIHKTLLEEVAKAEGKTIQEYLKARVDAVVPPPDEAAIQAFYDANKSEQTPPLEMVRDQVVQAMTSEKTDGALTTIIDEIEKKNGVERAAIEVALARST